MLSAQAGTRQINPVMTQIAFSRDVHIHMEANSLMRTFPGKGFTGNAFFGVHNNDSIRAHRDDVVRKRLYTGSISAF